MDLDIIKILNLARLVFGYMKSCSAHFLNAVLVCFSDFILRYLTDRTHDLAKRSYTRLPCVLAAGLS